MIWQVKVLVNHGANVNAQSSDGTTPLIAATALGDDGQAAKWLLEHGASTKIHDLDGVTPLHLAAERGFKDLVDSMVGGEIGLVLVYLR
jgi:ankyrin repeat protein